MANANKIKYQPEIPFPNLGRTNFPQLEKVGVKTGIINIPVRYQHTSQSQFSVSDAIEAMELLQVIVNNYSLFVNFTS